MLIILRLTVATYGSSKKPGLLNTVTRYGRTGTNPDADEKKNNHATRISGLIISLRFKIDIKPDGDAEDDEDDVFWGKDKEYLTICRNSILTSSGGTQPLNQHNAFSASSTLPRDNNHIGVSGICEKSTLYLSMLWDLRKILNWKF